MIFLHARHIIIILIVNILSGDRCFSNFLFPSSSVFGNSKIIKLKRNDGIYVCALSLTTVTTPHTEYL